MLFYSVLPQLIHWDYPSKHRNALIFNDWLVLRHTD